MLHKPPSSAEPRVPPAPRQPTAWPELPLRLPPRCSRAVPAGTGVSLLPPPLPPPAPGLKFPQRPGRPSSPGEFAGGSHATGRAEGRGRRQRRGVSAAQRGLIPPHSSHQCVVPLNPREPPSPEALLHFAEHESMRKKVLLGGGQP